MNQIIVVGASIAGVAAAEELRRLGFEGTIKVLGDEGHQPYDRPPLTKSVLAGKQTPGQIELRPAHWREEHSIDLRLDAPAVALDLRARAVELASGERVDYDGLVITTGATPRMLPHSGPPLPGVFTLRTLDDSLALRAMISPGANVVVVGGGFIGAEVAATAHRLGATVTLLEAEIVPLSRSVGPVIGQLFADVHSEEGVRVLCGVPVAGLEGEDRVELVRLADDTAINADVVVIGLGVRPATDWLEGSGLTLANGVVCDAYCRASAPDVVAAGDVARWDHPRLGPIRIEHWENAVMQGRAAAGALLGSARVEPYEPVPYVWSDQYDHKVQVVGLPQPEDQLVVVDGQMEERRFVAVYTRDDQVSAAISFNRPGAITKVRRLLRNSVTMLQVQEALAASSKRPQAPNITTAP
jgi:3-phenylpropionate/trans-cinnamate dioxygenase ferredoxin reductase component